MAAENPTSPVRTDYLQTAMAWAWPFDTDTAVLPPSVEAELLLLRVSVFVRTMQSPPDPLALASLSTDVPADALSSPRATAWAWPFDTDTETLAPGFELVLLMLLAFVIVLVRESLPAAVAAAPASMELPAVVRSSATATPEAARSTRTVTVDRRSWRPIPAGGTVAFDPVRSVRVVSPWTIGHRTRVRFIWTFGRDANAESRSHDATVGNTAADRERFSVFRHGRHSTGLEPDRRSTRQLLRGKSNEEFGNEIARKKRVQWSVRAAETDTDCGATADGAARADLHYRGVAAKASRVRLRRSEGRSGAR